MTSQEFVSTIFSAITGSALLTAALIFLFREWISSRIKASIQHEYDQNLSLFKSKLEFENTTSIETHKAKLKSESDISIEHLKAQLQITANTRNIQYSTIFEKQVEVISATTVLLHDFLDAASLYTSILNNVKGHARDAKRIATGEKYSEFLRYYRPRKMFIPKETTAMIDELHRQLHSHAIDFMFMVDQGNEIHFDPPRDTWSIVHDFMSKEVPIIQEKLEDDYRKIFGIISGET